MSSLRPASSRRRLKVRPPWPIAGYPRRTAIFFFFTLGWRRFWQGEGQDAVVEIGADIAGIHIARQAKGMLKGAVAAFGEIVGFRFFFAGISFLAFDRQHVIVQRDIDVFRGDPG